MTNNHKVFKVQELFEVRSTKSLDEGKLDFFSHGVNFIGRVNDANGIKGKIKFQHFPPNEANTITATVIGNYKYVKYQEEPYYCSQNINKLIPKFKMTKEIAMYLMTHISKFVSQYNGHQDGYKLCELKQHRMLLPVTQSGEPDFQYMEKQIHKLKEEQISKLLTHLETNGLKDYSLTKAEKSAVEKMRNKQLKNKEFKLGEGENRLFDICSTKKKFNANCIKFGGKYPYVARSSVNNGIRGYITENEKYLNNANTISFGQDTATIFYQEEPYFTGDKIKIFTYREKELNKNLACYLITAMKKAFQNFSWGQTSFDEKILNNIEIKLPISNDGFIDYNFIDNFINAQQKLALKGIVNLKTDK